MKKFLLLASACLLSATAHAATIPNLDMSNFTVDKFQDFTSTTAFDRSLWTNVFGTAFWLSGQAPDGLWMSSSQFTNPEWQQSGIMQLLGSQYGQCSSGFGYGLFHWRARAGQLHQGAGINLILWRADGLWIDPRAGTDVDTEIDALESWDGNGTAVATEHSYDTASSGNNHQVFHTLSFPAGTDITAMHDYDIDWEAGSLTMYVDKIPQWQTLGAAVPKDAAHGGCNETLGEQVVIQTGYEPLPTVQLMTANSGHYLAKVATVAPAATVISINTAQHYNVLAINGTLKGSPATISWSLDGVVQGQIAANVPAGTADFQVGLPTGLAPGKHTAVFYSNADANVSASYTFTE